MTKFPADNTVQILVGRGAFALVGAGGPLLISREHIATLTEFLIALQDIVEPEPDCEAPGLEDDFVEHPDDGPGCPVADIDTGIEDDRHDDDDPAENDDPPEKVGDELDVAWREEWRGNLNPMGEEDDEHDARELPVIESEDDEDDDPDTGVEDGASGDDGAPGDAEDAEQDDHAGTDIDNGEGEY